MILDGPVECVEETLNETNADDDVGEILEALEGGLAERASDGEGNLP